MMISPANAANPYELVPKGFEGLGPTDYGFPQNLVELLKSIVVGFDQILQNQIGIPESTSAGLALITFVGFLKLVELPFYATAVKNETKLRKELKKFTSEQIAKANTFDQMIENTNQNIAEKVMNEGNGKFGETNPLNTFGFSIFYRFFINFLLFFSGYETIFQLTLP